MNSGKLDNQLNLALDISEEERAETIDLDVGFDAESNTWELIVKYNGELQPIRDELGISIVELMNEYAVITIKQEDIGRLVSYQQIEFVEKPKRLSFEVMDGIPVSCIPPVQTTGRDTGTGQLSLFGNGVITAVIDSGIDYSHPDFRNEDGTTRIIGLWDQTINGASPEGFTSGAYFSEEQINEALAQPDRAGQMAIVPSIDSSGHGTHVCGICAGNGRASNGRYRGVAPQSDILVVKLGSSVGNSFPKTTNLMEAIDFVVRFAIDRGQPAAINISFGNSYGSHANLSLLEQYVDDMANRWKTNICIGTGNEGSLGHHKKGIAAEGKEETVELVISNYETAVNLQIWKNYYDRMTIEIISPGGSSAGRLSGTIGTNQFVLENTKILFYYGEPVPYNGLQEIYIEFIPTASYINNGIWRIRLTPEKIISGQYDMWLPTAEALNTMTRFIRPTEETTLTIPSTASRAVTVGAYDGNTDGYAYFSGRGFTRNNQWVKPDIVAPGVDITSCAVGGGYTRRTGTSMATPFVTGAVALMMEWGIVDGNDPYLYGEKVKAYLRDGARPLPGFEGYPNQQVGYGALCLGDSLPK